MFFELLYIPKLKSKYIYRERSYSTIHSHRIYIVFYKKLILIRIHMGTDNTVIFIYIYIWSGKNIYIRVATKKKNLDLISLIP